MLFGNVSVNEEQGYLNDVAIDWGEIYNVCMILRLFKSGGVDNCECDEISCLIEEIKEGAMNWNLFWSLYIFAFGLACWICFYIWGIRKWKKGKRCSNHTIGIVRGASTVQYAGVRIPVVEYRVGGRTYKVSGPKFRSGSFVSVTTPFASPNAQMETNLTTRENLPLHLNIRMKKNSFVNVEQSPLFRLYPIGSEVDVFYNPAKPKEAFVQRYEGVAMWLPVLLGSLAVILTAVGFVVLFGPEIVMK